MTQHRKEASMSHVDEGTLHAYLDGELPSAERAAWEAHIAQCEACRARLGEERALLERASALLGAARPLERPAPPLEQLRRVSRRSPWRVRTSFAWAASLALALGLGYYVRDFLGAYRMAPEPAAHPTVAQHRTERDQVAVAPPPAAAAAATRSSAPRPKQQNPGSGRIDSNALKVAARNGPDMRGAAPGAAAAAAPAPTTDSMLGFVTQVAPAMELTERKASANTWPRIDRETAKAILGEDPVGLADLTTRDYRRSPDREGVVLVEQQLDDRTVIQIFQQQTARANARFDSLLDRGGRTARGNLYGDRERADRLARFVGKLRVEIGGPVSVDSLNRLLEQVVRLP
jgi:putative zinc finger protein